MHRHSIAELSKLLSQKAISSVELAQHFLKRIQNYDSKLNSFITVSEEFALTDAKAADERIAQGTHHPLTGIPIAHKDIFCTFGIKTTNACKILSNFIAPYDATVVHRFKEAGMVLLGKTNMDEMAMGSSNETSFYGSVKNPWDLSRVPGGSSGGSAAALAAGLTPAATGTDTGGSIRQPAALSGLTGLKPTYGRVSRYGMIAYASSLDQAGPMAHSAEDCAYLLQAMAGFDPKDSTSVEAPVPDYLSQLSKPLKGLKIGIPKEFFVPELDPQVAQLVEAATKIYQELGATLVPIHLPNMHLSVPTYYIIAPAECSSNLARYDGVRYGYRCSEPKDLNDLYTRTRAEGFGDEIKRRIMIGTYVLSSGFYDAFYVKAQKVRQLIAQDFREAFKEVDFILGPTSPTVAFKAGEKMSDPISMYLSDIFTISTNLAGLPAISIPVGLANGLPVGMQLIGNSFQEGLLLNAAHQYQQHTHWHTLMPETFA